MKQSDQEWIDLKINAEICTGCGNCSLVCKKEAISRKPNYEIIIIPERCTDCATCRSYCPNQAIISIAKEG